jgi:hypothetical protein
VIRAETVAATSPGDAGELADYLANFLEVETGCMTSALTILDAMACFGVVGASEEFMRRVSS